jgi:hypothetical protein
MRRWIPREVAIEERIERLKPSHPYRVELTVDPNERHHLLRHIETREDVVLISERIGGWRLVVLELVCSDLDTAKKFEDAY